METTALIFRYVLVTEIGTCVVTSRQVVSHHETMAMGRWADGNSLSCFHVAWNSSRLFFFIQGVSTISPLYVPV
jgi:hypothetical protein